MYVIIFISCFGLVLKLGTHYTVSVHWLTLTREHVALSSLHVEALAVLQRLTLPSAELGAAPTGRRAGSPVRPLLPSCTTYYLSDLFNTVLRNPKKKQHTLN